MSLSHHPLCMTLWSGESEHCECPEVNTCRACSDTCKECTWEQETCECYTHADYDEVPT